MQKDQDKEAIVEALKGGCLKQIWRRCLCVTGDLISFALHSSCFGILVGILVGIVVGILVGIGGTLVGIGGTLVGIGGYILVRGCLKQIWRKCLCVTGDLISFALH